MSKSLSAASASPKKLAQALLGGAGAILIGGCAAVFALNSQIKTLNGKSDTREAEVGSSEQVARRYQMTLDAYNETLGKIQYLETSVSQSSYVPTLLQQLQALAASTRLTVVAVRPSPAPVLAAPPAEAVGALRSKKKVLPPPYDTQDISVDVKGSYASTAAFLYDLTRFPKIVSVKSAQLRPEATEPGQNPLSSPSIMTNLHLTAYVFHDDANAPGAPGTLIKPSAGAPGTLIQPSAAAFVAPEAHPSTVGGAANSVAGAIGASKAAGRRSEVGIPTL